MLARHVTAREVPMLLDSALGIHTVFVAALELLANAVLLRHLHLLGHLLRLHRPIRRHLLIQAMSANTTMTAHQGKIAIIEAKTMPQAFVQQILPLLHGRGVLLYKSSDYFWLVDLELYNCGEQVQRH